ncbi:MAG TPA: hypothetical protein VLQ80_34290 [Candidatus Saccharimonadia bacterium]|nr:hypothetical protein [Candidatus Saccharimonadia bacterium]
MLYRSLLARFEPGRKLFLAVHYSIFVSRLNEPMARPVLEDLMELAGRACAMFP